MRRALLLILVVGLLTAAPAAADPNPQTVGLQVALRAHGLYKGEIDGIRGPATVHAVTRSPLRYSPSEVNASALRSGARR